MVNNKEHKTLNVPPLRFPGFTDEWKDVHIDEVGKVVTGNTPSTKESKYYDNGTHLWASPSDLGYNKMVDSTQTLLSEVGFSKTRIIPKGSVLVTCIGSTIGKMGMAATEMSTNQQINSIVVDESNDADFIYYSLMSRFPKYKGEIAVQAVPLISKSSFEKLDIGVCELPEQRKIGKLLSLIDERIATQNKIIEDYRTLINSIMKRVFFNDNWKEIRLGEICERVIRKNSNNESNLVLTIAAQYGLVSQTDFFNKSVASENLSNYFLLKKGDFAYNKSYSGDYTWGAIKRLDLYETGVLSPLYICFRPKDYLVDSDFLTYLFESKCWYREVAEICVEGARNHGLLNVSVNDFFNLKLRIPTLSEQKDIARMLKTFTNKIEESQRLLSLYTKQKQYLLNSMFV